jgi:hypothetical protein
MLHTTPVDDSALETASTGSETSAAVVSLYNSWSSVEAGNFQDDDDTLQEDDRFATLPFGEAKLSNEELLQQLKKRCRDEDIPKLPQLRRRRLPVCQFLNFMGTRQVEKSEEPREPLILPQLELELELDLGLEEKDVFFPLYCSKAKHQDDDTRSQKKHRRVSDSSSAYSIYSCD